MRRRQYQHGFAVIELLLVIAILAVLLGLTLGAAAPARRMSRVTTCLSHLRQLGQVYQMYAADYGHYPAGSEIVTGPYVKDKRLLYCPDDTFRAPHGAASSYMLREGMPPDGAGLWQISVVNPNHVLAACDQHLQRSVIHLGDDRTEYTAPQYPFHLALRANGAVDRIHVDRIRKIQVRRLGNFVLPAEPPAFMDVYPGEPGYDQAKPAAANREGSSP